MLETLVYLSFLGFAAIGGLLCVTVKVMRDYHDPRF